MLTVRREEMMRHLLVFIFAIWFIFLSVCSENPNEKANVLYIEDSQLMESVKTEIGSYSKAFESYQGVQKKLERILSKYASSSIAVNLMSGQTKISGFTLSEFRKLKSSLKALAEAEQNPFLCALIVAKKIKDARSKALVLAEIAGKYAEAGQFTQALQTVKTIGNAALKARALAVIAVKYADAGQQLSKKDMVVLRDIVHTIIPMRQYWK